MLSPIHSSVYAKRKLYKGSSSLIFVVRHKLLNEKKCVRYFVEILSSLTYFIYGHV